ncbi:hypothetical protein HOB10_05265 [Candidatus Parcubacteria bacterium]|nr:hypothetical protein [Candidatus Parcubacteria bacterium]
MNRADHFVYLSHIEQGKEGHLMTKLLYNHLAENNVMFSPHWYIIGQFSNITNISVVTSYFIWRILLLIPFLFLLWWFIKKIFSSYKKSILAMLTILFGNGIGTIFINIFPESTLKPTNLWMPESITFLSLNQTPLFVLALILILLVFISFIESVKSKKNYLILICCSLNLLLTLIHTYDMVITLAVLTGWSAFKFYQTRHKKIILYLAYLYFVSGTGALYYAWLLRRDLAMIQWNAQNLCISGPLTEYLWGMGLLFVFSIAGIVYIIKKRLFQNDYLNLITVWAAIGWVLIYLPVHFNRRLSNGWHMALAITSLYFFLWLHKKFPVVLRGALITVVGFLVFFDTMIFLSVDSSVTRSNESHYFFHSQTKQEIYQQIQATTDEHDVILTRGIDGNHLPGFTARKVYTGHLMGTWEAVLKNREVEKLWSNPNDISEWLVDKNIAYIFASRFYIPEFDKIKWLAKEKYIEPIIDNDEFILYKILLEE